MNLCQSEKKASHSDGDQDVEDLDILSQQPGLPPAVQSPACTFNFHNFIRRLIGNTASLLRESDQLDAMIIGKVGSAYVCRKCKI
jgi:hypothetical protein